MKKATLSLLFLLITSSFCFATDEHKAVTCILGEARGETYQGMLAVAEFIRKNGTNRLVGCNSKIPLKEWVYMEKKGIIQRAFKAWYDSKYTNLIGGATHFENVKAFGKPWWSKKMIIVKKIGSHTFYKEI